MTHERVYSIVMFSGAKHRLKQWRQKKAPSKIMAYSKESFLNKLKNSSENLKNLKVECNSIVQTLYAQVKLLSEIDEDTAAVEEKIYLLQEHLKYIEGGLQESEGVILFADTIDSLNNAIKKENSEIEDLQKQASTLFIENKKLRTQLQIFQDHHERSELRAVELDVQIEHLKFISTLPSENVPFFENGEQFEIKEEELKIAIEAPVAISFIGDTEHLENAGSHILSVLDSLDFSENSRLKILFDLIKSYVQDEAYEVAIPLLKTTIEDLSAKHSAHEKIIFSMMEVLLLVYEKTQRFKDAKELQTEILQIRRGWMPDDEIGLAQTLSSLAVLYSKTGKVKAARIFCRESLEIKNKVYGEDSLETGVELHNMGVLYSYDKQYSKAIDCMLTAFNIIKSCSKRDAFIIATIAANVAMVHLLNKEMYQARGAFRSTLKFLHRELGKLLEGYNTLKDEILSNVAKIDEIADIDDKKQIKKIVQLIAKVEDKSKAVAHLNPEEKNKLPTKKYCKLSVNTSDED